MLDRVTEVCILLSGFGIGSVALMVIPSPMEVRALTPYVATTLKRILALCGFVPANWLKVLLLEWVALDRVPGVHVSRCKRRLA